MHLACHWSGRRRSAARRSAPRLAAPRLASPCRAAVQPLESRLLFATYFVDASQAAGVHLGLSWNDAFPTLTEALAIVASGDTVKLAAGTYKPTAGTDRTASFQLRGGITLTGGFNGRQSVSPDAPSTSPTRLSGEIGTPVASDNAFHVLTAVSLSGFVTLEDLTIESGNTVGAAGDNDDGAGLLIRDAGVAATRCRFQGNATSADGRGGAVFIAGSVGSSFTLCNFVGNTALSGGAAAATGAVNFFQCTFTANSATSGGGLYVLTGNIIGFVGVSRSDFNDNTADFGAAIANTGNSEILVTNSVFSYNQAGTNGGAIDTSFSSLSDLRFCTFTRNTAGGSGGALSVFQSTLNLIDSVLWLDTVAGRTEELFVFPDTTPASTTDVSFSLVQGGFPGGTNILNADPQFVRGDNGQGPPDLRLRFGSPAIDAGSALGTGFVAIDHEGRSRNTDAGLARDLGAYEGAVDVTPPVSAVSPLPAVTTSASLALTVSGTDVPAGIASYALFVSDNGGLFSLVATQPGTAFTFSPLVDGHTYAFYSVATDTAGNVESKSVADATTTASLDAPLLTERGDGQTASPNLVASRPKVTLPKAVAGAVVGGSTVKGSLTVTNAGPSVAGGTLAVAFYLSADAVLSSKDTLLATVTARRPLRLKPRGTTTLPFSLTLPITFTGTANLLALLNPAAGGVALPAPESSTLDNALAVAAFPLAVPSLNLATGTLAVKRLTRGRSATASLRVLNPSNVDFNAALPVTVTVRDAAQQVVFTQTTARRQKVAVGRQTNLTLRFTAPSTPGSYTLEVLLNPAAAQTSTADDRATLALSVP